MQYKTYHKVLVFVIPIASLAVLGLLAAFILQNFKLWDCPFNTLLHIWCPGCGATRSATALMHGDIPLSLRQNAAVIAAIILITAWYVELVLNVFGKKVRFPLIHNPKFYYILLAVWLAYAVARNLIPAIAPVGVRDGLGLIYN